MDYYGNNDWRDYLAHHGILGQKWGTRNGPPYPLDGSDHSASEKKAGWRKSLGDGSDSSIRKKNRYVKKESKRIEKSYKKDIKRADRAERRSAKKYNKSVEKGSRSSERLKEKYNDARIDSEALKRTKSLELERVRNMTLKDIKDEKKLAKDTKKQLKGRLSDSNEFYQTIRKKRENKKELQETKSNKRVTQGERNQIKEQVRKEIKEPAKTYDPSSEFKASEKEVKKYVSDLNKTLKSTQQAVNERDNATKYQTIRNPAKESGVSTFKLSNRSLDEKANAALRDWGTKYLTAEVYAEANGYTLEYDAKKNKHYLKKK